MGNFAFPNGLSWYKWLLVPNKRVYVNKKTFGIVNVLYSYRTSIKCSVILCDRTVTHHLDKIFVK